MEYNIIIKGYKPLCCYKEGMILYRAFKFYFLNKNNELNVIGEMKTQIKKRLLSKMRLTERMFRLSPKASLLTDDNKLIFSFLRAIYCLDINKKKVSKIATVRNGFSDPLSFSPSRDKNQFIALYGDYGSNSNRDEVNIYGITLSYTVKKLYTFKAGSIRHIHNIIIDNYGNGYYVLTGDNEISAGIYKANNEMSEMIPIAVGNQLYRAVTGFSLQDGLLYATDSVSSQNYICFLKRNGSTYETLKLKEINGSCIHGMESKDAFLFSTTVESDESSTNKYIKFLSNKRGKGIKTNYVDVIRVSRDFNFDILCSFKKDIYPMKLFQYGKVKFPENLKSTDNIIIYPIAIKKYDDMVLKF